MVLILSQEKLANKLIRRLKVEAMNEIRIPPKINVAGFKVEILTGEYINKGLQELKRYGSWHCDNLGKHISIDTSVNPKDVSNTFIHECIEAVNSIYLDHSLKEKEINAVANGLHQIFEGMKVRFAK